MDEEKERKTYHLPQLVGSRELFASAFHNLREMPVSALLQRVWREKAYKSLLIERPTALLVFDIGKPWLDTARVPQKILFVDGILIGLVQNRIVSLVPLVYHHPAWSLTIRYKSGPEADDRSISACCRWDLGGRSVPGISPLDRAGSAHTVNTEAEGGKVA